ncbi:hypothetical protein AAFF_G00356310 [Aldrovandia affinis]|uniref:Uncharacterized protein n=1 Tax=Aldrovandia affinis TaxID=143900 RepID=A0AAD7T9L6_9TELE|nr:hypothetical protein AAFF_G00356310 [Aldrovandia affinis]
MCSVSCGKGTKQRDVVCVDERQVQVEEESCSHLQKPRAMKVCRAKRCPGWKANQWSQCSVSCGVGRQEREVYCRLKGAGRVGEDQCDPLVRPTRAQSCFFPECPSQHTWAADVWQNCNATCGEGTRTRRVLCVDGASNPAQEALCEPSSRPSLFQPCRSVPCQYVWMTGDWSQCSASCGPGYQQRMISCSEVHSSLDPRSYVPQASPTQTAPNPILLTPGTASSGPAPPQPPGRLGPGASALKPVEPESWRGRWSASALRTTPQRAAVQSRGPSPGRPAERESVNCSPPAERFR